MSDYPCKYCGTPIDSSTDDGCGCDGQRIEELEDKYEALKNAVNDLPVEEVIHEDGHGVELLGYFMQAQGEWDAVLKALQEG